jgi:cytidine deaminase
MKTIYQKIVDKANSLAKRVKHTDGCKSGDVACALLTERGHIYSGVNLFCDCGIGFCAEHTAIATMITKKETKIKAIAAVDHNGKLLPPCGRCRELLFQVNYGNLDTDIILSKNKVVKLKALLPHRWQEIYFKQK